MADGVFRQRKEFEREQDREDRGGWGSAGREEGGRGRERPGSKERCVLRSGAQDKETASGGKTRGYGPRAESELGLDAGTLDPDLGELMAGLGCISGSG